MQADVMVRADGADTKGSTGNMGRTASAGSSTNKTNDSNGSNRPVQKFRAGAVVATIWMNEATRKDGETANYATVTLSRIYKDRNGAWKDSNSLRLNDLPKAELVLKKAYEYLALSDAEN